MSSLDQNSTTNCIRLNIGNGSAKDIGNSNDSPGTSHSISSSLNSGKKRKRYSISILPTKKKVNKKVVINDATELDRCPEKMDRVRSQKEEEQSKQITELSAKLDMQRELINEFLSSGIEIAAKGKWVNSADLTEPRHLAVELQRIFKNEWRDTKRSLIANLHNYNKNAALPTSSLKDIDVIKWLSYILQECYSFCETKANLPMSQFFAAFSTNAKLEFAMVKCSDVERYYFLKMRKTVGMRSDVMEGIVQGFWSKCISEEEQSNSHIITDEDEQNWDCDEGEICNSNDCSHEDDENRDSYSVIDPNRREGISKVRENYDNVDTITDSNKQKGSNKEGKRSGTSESNTDPSNWKGTRKEGKISENAESVINPSKRKRTGNKDEMSDIVDSITVPRKQGGSDKEGKICGSAENIANQSKQEEGGKEGGKEGNTSDLKDSGTELNEQEGGGKERKKSGTVDKLTDPSKQERSDNQDEINDIADSITDPNIADHSIQEGGSKEGNISDITDSVTEPSKLKGGGNEGKIYDTACTVSEPSKQAGSSKKGLLSDTAENDTDRCKEIGSVKDGKISDTASSDTDPSKTIGRSKDCKLSETANSDTGDNDHCKEKGSGKHGKISSTADFVSDHCKQEGSDKEGNIHDTADKEEGTSNKDEINYIADSVTVPSTPQRRSVKQDKLYGTADNVTKTSKQEGSGKEGKISDIEENLTDPSTQEGSENECKISDTIDIVIYSRKKERSGKEGNITCTAGSINDLINQKGCSKKGKLSDTADRNTRNGEVVEESCKSDIGTDTNKIICSYIMQLKSNGECLKQFRKYVTVCINACWKAVISYPPVHLQFNLTGKNFTDVDEKYGLKKYTLNMPYRDTSKKHDEIALVVWPPCITYEHGSHEENVLAAENARVVVNNLDEC